MKKDRCLKIFLASLCLISIVASCNFPGPGSSPEATETPSSFKQDTAVPPLSPQPTEAVPTKAPDVQPPDQPEGEPFVTVITSMDCLEAPLDGSNVVLEFSPGEKAPVLGITPNLKWIAVKPKGHPNLCWLLTQGVEMSVDVESLEILPPPATSTPGLGSIAGVLWHEICEYSGGQAGEPLVLVQGCVQWGAESWEFGPNQVYDPFESGWEGVTLHLGAGVCPSTGLATTMTNVDGEYIFTGLSAGTYCVSYTNLGDGNDTILIPGGPTFPERGEDGFYQTVNLSQGEDRIGVDFGYAFQFYD